MEINIILFPNFETLDVFGPAEVFGKVEKFRLDYFSLNGGIITNNDNIRIATKKIEDIKNTAASVLFIPGGTGTRIEINNPELLNAIKKIAENSKYVLTVCTGSALLAKTGLLDTHKATSNKRAMDWVKTSSDKVLWDDDARWIKDDKYYTSSGISAGIDMALSFVKDLFGFDEAEKISLRMEYNWQTEN